MKKITLLFYALLLATVGAWAQEATTEWIDYSALFNTGTWKNWNHKTSTESVFTTGWGFKVESAAPAGYNIPITVQEASKANNLGWGTRFDLRRPWLAKGSQGGSFTVSVPDGYKIADYELVTMAHEVRSDYTGCTFTYTGADGQTVTSPVQSGTETKSVKVTGLNSQSFTLGLSGYSGAATSGIFIVELRVRLIINNSVNVTINVQNDSEDVQYYTTVKLPKNTTITLRDYLPSFSFVTYNSDTYTTGESDATVSLGYTVDEDAEKAIPFAKSYSELGEQNWVSFFTLNGRMHVRDEESEGNVYDLSSDSEHEGNFTIISSEKKYPTIDKATFTRLNSGFFWGFVRAKRFSPTYIVNKGAGENQYLYLTRIGNNRPVLMDTDDNAKSAAWVTKEWVLESTTYSDAVNSSDKYFGIRAQGTNAYINNYNNTGFMTTQDRSQNQNSGSNIKFTPQLDTYEVLKDRALNAPYDAVHSLNQLARDKVLEADQQIADNSSMTVQEKIVKYEEVIAYINSTHNDAGFIDFEPGKYYYLRNYTPAGSGQKTYFLASENGTTRTATQVVEGLGDASNPMTYFNINAIWQITTSDVSTPAPGTGIGASRTIARKITHANSGMQLGAINNASLVAKGSGSDYYFIDLGAGQHFMKNVQYNGSGQQAKAKPLSCTDGGTVQEGPEIHKKNTRDTWYGIQVTEIPVTLPANGDGYATICLPFGVSFKENRDDLTAYAVTSVSGGVATLEGSKYIPANKGAILKGTAGKTYTLTIDDTVNEGAEGTSGWSKNLLEGSCMATNISESAYVLSNPGDGVGLYKAKETSGTWLNNANKAYLPASKVTETSGSGRFLSFNFDTVTGLDVISGTGSGSEESVVYDLSGRRVRTAQKGMYIVNGKKVIK